MVLRSGGTILFSLALRLRSVSQAVEEPHWTAAGRHSCHMDLSCVSGPITCVGCLHLYVVRNQGRRDTRRMLVCPLHTHRNRETTHPEHKQPTLPGIHLAGY